jgi:hypothetical protein
MQRKNKEDGKAAQLADYSLFLAPRRNSWPKYPNLPMPNSFSSDIPKKTLTSTTILNPMVKIPEERCYCQGEFEVEGVLNQFTAEGNPETKNGYSNYEIHVKAVNCIDPT